MTTPEWNIFSRLEELEDITLKIMEKAETTAPTLNDIATTAKDARNLAIFGVAMSFVSFALSAHLENPRKLKDSYIKGLKHLRLNQKLLEVVDSSLIEICELLEETKTAGN